MQIKNGLLSTIEYGGLSVDLCDDLQVFTNKSVFKLSELKCEKSGDEYIFKTDAAVFKVGYNRVDNTAFITRTLKIEFLKETTLEKIEVKVPNFDEQFMYNTFFNASAAAFFRKGESGLCCGFENPYCVLDGNSLYFEPRMTFKSGEEYVCDLNFYGIYELYGEKINPELNRSQIDTNGRSHPRYRNPSEGIPLYFSEIFEFNKYTKNYFESGKKEFKFMTYDFFGNLPQRPQGKDVELYLKHIDAVCKIGCDTILLNPLFPNEIPNGDENSYWKLFPENTEAEKIVAYAREKGLKIGVYTGTAGNGVYGNSSMIGYCDNSKWKKVDIKGGRGDENCIADDDFADWFIKVQINTIKKYNLDLWNWDPGPGNAFFCHSDEHGHVAGKGAYKGFRNSLRVMKAIKEACPNIYYQGFHGNKEYGLWGFKYTDQHEAFWENEVYVMNPVFDDLSVDRVTADNIRQQSIWNYYFRFMPMTLNHGIAHRMVQANWMGLLNLDTVFDYNGFKFALLSAIAYGGPITLTILPREPENIEGYVDFYKEWIAFAKEHFRESDYAIPIGSQVGCGIDAVARIKENNGHIFAFNPFPKDYEFEFNVSKRCGFDAFEGELQFNMIYPYRKKAGAYKFGDTVKITVPAYGCVALEIGSVIRRRETLPKLPRVLGQTASGEYTFFADQRIKELISKHKISETAISAQAEYQKMFGRVNSVWPRPDRLWLCVKSQEPNKNATILLGGKAVSWQQDFLAHNELCAKNMIFADVTEQILWGKENVISLEGFNESAVYLYYEKPENEELSENGEAFVKSDYSAPLLDDTIKILSADVNGDNIIVPMSQNTLTVKVNVPAEELEGVYASVPISIGDTGYELKRDMALEFKDGVWTKTFKSNERICLIIDDFKLSIWAVTKKKRESEAYHLPIEWLMK